MSWLETAKSSRKHLISLSFLLLGGCLQPLYGPLANGGSVQGELEAIAVDPIPDRLGHYLGNELIFAFNGTGSHPTPKYRLLVSLKERVQTPLVDTVTGRATAASVIVDADYRLIPIGGGEPITGGTAFGMSTYDRTSQRLNNVRAARDAETRDAQQLADQIRTRVSAALATRS